METPARADLPSLRLGPPAWACSYLSQKKMPLGGLLFFFISSPVVHLLVTKGMLLGSHRNLLTKYLHEKWPVSLFGVGI